MKVMPVASPHNMIQQNATTSNASSARDKAIAAFTQQGDQSPVQSQNSVSPEELSAIQPPRQADSIEATSSDESQPEAEAKPETPVDTEVSRKYAEIARQEKASRQRAIQRDQHLKQREAALAAREAELAAKPAPPQIDMSKYVPKDLLKQDFLTALQDAGMSYDEAVQQVINQQQRDPRVTAEMQALKNQIQELRQAQEDGKKAQAEQQTQAYKAAVQQIRQDARHLVKMDPAFELVRAASATEDVVELIEQTFKAEGRLLSVEEAAQEVEAYLEEEAFKLTRLSKIQEKLKQSNTSNTQPQKQQQAAQSQQKQPQPMKTLTNATSSSRQLSARERAVLAFKGELKS